MKLGEKLKAISSIILGVEKTPEQSRANDASLRGSFSGLFESGDSGIVVTEESSLKFSAVWGCMRLLSELPASLPIDTIEEKNNTRTIIEHDIKEVLAKPNFVMNGFTYHETMNAWLQGWGNGVAVIDNRLNGRASSIYPIHPSSVQAKILDGKVYYVVNDELLGIKGTFYSEEIIHYKMFSTTGLWGKSPILTAKENIGLGLAAEKFGSRFFKKGGNLKAVIETDNHMDDKSFVQWKDRWNKFYTGDMGDHETPILEWGLKYKQLGIPPEAAQFILTREFQLRDVCRVFNMPPHLVGDLARSTFSNIEQQDIQFVKYTLRSLLRRQELELEQKLLTEKDRKTIRIRFNLDAMLRGDLATVTAHIKEMVLSGVITPNEGRRLLNLNPIVGGDDRYIPANIIGNNNNQQNA
jgi:HK97 family phage portal protein